MVRVVLTYGSTSPRLRADLSSLTGRLVSVRVVHGPICLVPINMSLFKVWMILAADDSSRDFSFASVTSAHFSCCFGFSCFVYQLYSLNNQLQTYHSARQTRYTLYMPPPCRPHTSSSTKVYPSPRFLCRLTALIKLLVAVVRLQQDYQCR